MNMIRLPDPNPHEIGRIRAVVEQVAFPEFVRGFEVELGVFDDEPAMWIIFRTAGARPAEIDLRKRRAEQLREFKDQVHQKLIPAFDDRYPYYRFLNDDQVS